MTTMIEIIGLIAGVLAIFGAIYAVWKRYRHRVLILITPLQDPKKPVSEERLSIEDTYQGINNLIEDARRFNPDYIFGINRGGAIVGGILAKKLQKPQVYILYVNLDHDSSKHIIEHRGDTDTTIIKNGEKILLVDDALRNDEHMRIASEYLKKTYPNIELRRMVVLQIKMDMVGPEKCWLPLSIEHSAYYTFLTTVKLPWDP